MPEKPPRSMNPNIGQETLMKGVEEVGTKISSFLQLRQKQQLQTQVLNGHSILILPDASNPLTKSEYEEIYETCATSGMKISFDEDEQIVRVSPVKN